MSSAQIRGGDGNSLVDPPGLASTLHSKCLHLDECINKDGGCHFFILCSASSLNNVSWSLLRVTTLTWVYFHPYLATSHGEAETQLGSVGPGGGSQPCAPQLPPGPGRRRAHKPISAPHSLIQWINCFLAS